MKGSPIYIIGLIGIWLLACNPEDTIITDSPSAKLTLSTDTILFDTLLTQRLSITKRFRIFNESENAVSIASIRLGLGSQSVYRIFANGREGPEINDLVVNGGDSVLVLVDLEVTEEDVLNLDLPYIVKDSVIVDWNGNTNHVKLVAWGQDAIYIHNELLSTQTWTANRPYVIYDTAVVDENEVLTVEPGTRIYIDNGSSLFVLGTLKILGDSADRVIIRNTRFDENYLEAPGQWVGIFFLEGSKDNEIRYADIENGELGLRIGSPDEDDEYDVVISHTIIRHMSVSGILAFTSDVYAYNTLIYNCGQVVIGNFAGGNYRYEHCTFTNHPNFFVSDDPSIQFSDFIQTSETETLVADLTIDIENSILWGSNEEELVILSSGEADIMVNLNKNIIRDKSTIAENYTSLDDNFPGFTDPVLFDYTLDSLAFARNKGASSSVTDDLTGNPRDGLPDIGAYERRDSQ